MGEAAWVSGVDRGVGTAVGIGGGGLGTPMLSEDPAAAIAACPAPCMTADTSDQEEKAGATVQQLQIRERHQ